MRQSAIIEVWTSLLLDFDPIVEGVEGPAAPVDMMRGSLLARGAPTANFGFPPILTHSNQSTHPAHFPIFPSAGLLAYRKTRRPARLIQSPTARSNHGDRVHPQDHHPRGGLGRGDQEEGESKRSILLLVGRPRRGFWSRSQETMAGNAGGSAVAAVAAVLPLAPDLLA